MSSFGNAIENWSLRGTGDISDLQHKLVSEGCARSSSPIKAMAAVVDSAYSSFSGSSYVTDYQPFQHGSCHLNEQISYMDSDYVKAIYNPSTADQIHFQQNMGFEDCSSKNYLSGRISKLGSSSQVTLDEDHLSLMRINDYTTTQHFEQSDSNRESGDHFSHKSKRSPTSTSDFSSPEHKLSRHYFADHSPTLVRNPIQGEWNQSCVTSSSQEKEVYPHFTSTSFATSVSNLAKSHNINCIGNENDSLQVSTSNTDCFEQKDFHTIQQICVKKEEENPSSMLNMCTNYCLDEGVATKSTRRSLNELVSQRMEVRSGSWKPAQETNCYSDEGTTCEGVEDLAHNQVLKEQYQPQSQNMKDLECESVGQWDIKHKGLHTKNSQTLYSRPSEDLFEQPSKALNREDLQKVSKTYVRKDATIKSVPLLSQEQELTMPLTSNFSELTSEKITKASTPMLYHLAGGRNSSFVMLNFKNQPKHLDAPNESKTFQSAINSSTPQVAEPQKPLQKTKSPTQFIDHFVSDCSEYETADNLTSSEEIFMYDYREKLKVAQKKVLRETSFKRKDLQMSLPVRLKWNAPKRPTFDHVRSYSLSGSNEEAKFVPPKTLVDNNCKNEELEKPVISRIGGRKRLTKEQRKLCYSEPEKLDHLGVQNNFSVWNNEGSSQTKLGEHHRMKSADKERTLSTSNLSKIELKQIQHNALVEYMERKANQRPNSIHQSQMQKPSGRKSSSEWKCMSNEMSSIDLPQPYYHRRSTGASSSYDATVTWNDRLLKMSQGDPVNFVEDTVNSKPKTYLDISPLNNNKCYVEDSSAAVSQKNLTSVNPSQVSGGHLTSSTVGNSSTSHDNRLSVTMDSSAHEKEEVCKARIRGKSMEELGTSERIRLSVLSQSSEQLCHIKGPGLRPQPGNVSSTAVGHQDELKSSPEPGSRPRQTSEEDLLGPHRSETAKSAHERHSSPQTASGASPSIDNFSTSPPSQFYPRTTEKSHCLQTDNEIFAQPNRFSIDDTCRPHVISLEDTRQSLCDSEELLQAHSALLMHSHLLQPARSMHTASYEANAKIDPWYNNEVKAAPNDLSKSSEMKEPSVSTENQDSGEVNEDLKSTKAQSINILQQANVDSVSSSHENRTEIARSSFHGKIKINNEASGQESYLEEQSDAPEESFTKLEEKSQTEERYTELVKAITAKDKSLVDVLKPLPVRESAISLMKSLFSVDISTRERSKNQELKNKMNIENLSKSMVPEKTCIHKADGECLDDITFLKRELISCINSQLEELCSERELLLSEISENTNHGTSIEAVVKEVCKPNEYERYMMFIGDLEKVVSLLFCLSMRLARVENALSKIDKNTDAEEMQSLKERHSLLSRQREDAKDLKDNLDRREKVVTGILAKYLSETQLEDYKHFVWLKTSLLIKQKDLDEKIKFHEEQLENLHNSIPP